MKFICFRRAPGTPFFRIFSNSSVTWAWNWTHYTIIKWDRYVHVIVNLWKLFTLQITCWCARLSIFVAHASTLCEVTITGDDVGMVFATIREALVALCASCSFTISTPWILRVFICVSISTSWDTSVRYSTHWAALLAPEPHISRIYLDIKQDEQQ